jgi:hypothetical protein
MLSISDFVTGISRLRQVSVICSSQVFGQFAGDGTEYPVCSYSCYMRPVPISVEALRATRRRREMRIHASLAHRPRAGSRVPLSTMHATRSLAALNARTLLAPSARSLMRSACRRL